jgi:MFS family permease
VRTIGLIAALNGVVIVVAQPLWVRVTQAWPAWRGLCLGAIFVALGALGVAHAREATHFAVSMVLASLGEVAFSSAAPTYVAAVAPPDRRASYQGAHSLVWAMASLGVPLLGPRLSAWFGATGAWTLGAVLCACAALAHATFTRRA